jgi:predicted transcriptional regulator
MKRSTSFRLSEESLKALEQLANRFHMSEAAVLERLILDRHAISDSKANAKRKRQATKEAISSLTQPEALFIAGYNAGWLHFQTRHGDSAVIEPV